MPLTAGSRRRSFGANRAATLIVPALVAAALPILVATGTLRPQPPDAAGDWDSDHVGQPVPDYMTGDECLFCHRADVGPQWERDPHADFMRPLAADAAMRERLEQHGIEPDLTWWVLGRSGSRILLRPGEAYGTFDMAWSDTAPGEPSPGDPTAWTPTRFGGDCAGCHTTGVNAREQSFSAPSIDCYACHGDVDREHANDPTLVLMAGKGRDHPRQIVAVCGQCHLRGGHSAATRRPYPDNFVAGDNLFRDFQVDFSPEHLAALDPWERHIYESARDSLQGVGERHCLTCHDVHQPSTRKHQELEESDRCATCHDALPLMDGTPAWRQAVERFRHPVCRAARP